MMKQAREFPAFTVTPKAARSLAAGHPWVYAEEVLDAQPCENGALADVFSQKGSWLGTGLVSLQSKIRVRVFSRNANDVFDEAFWRRRLRYAWEYRKAVMGPDVSNCRIIFGEADFLPGLVIDKFSDVLVVESLALGIDKMKLQIVDILKKVLLEDGIKIRGVYERSDAKERLKEGMDRKKGFIGDEFDTDVKIVENGVRYIVDVKDGQKTGFFLDQKYNRLAMQRICKDMDVLDCFTHTGSFALNAGIAGAKHVLGVDASELAVAQAQKNAALNHLSDTVEFKCADVFDLLPALENEGKQFDVVILDPPAFTKSKNAIKNAVKGYREINLRGMKLVKDGGYLATCSCSHYMNAELFAQTIGQAARAAHCRLRQVEFRTQSPDHPILWSADESYYLKFYIFQVCHEH